MGYWRVREVVEKPGLVLAELEEVEWFKPNPAYVAMMEEYDALVASVGQEEADRITAERSQAEEERTGEIPYVQEAIDAVPGDEGADCIEGAGRMKLDITDGPEMHPLDNVLVEVRVLASVEV